MVDGLGVDGKSVERQVLLDAISIRGINPRQFAETAAALGVLGRKQVAFAGVRAHDLAGASDLEPLGDRLPSFDTFGASHKFNSNSLQKSGKYRLRFRAKQAVF